MHKFVFLEIKKILLSCTLTAVFFVAVLCILAWVSKGSYVFFRNIELWEESNEVFSFIYAALASVPVCWILYYERKDHYIIYTLPRISKKKYLFTKWLIAAAAGALIIFLISFGWLLISLYVFDSVAAIPDMNDRAETGHFAGYWFVNHPLRYGLLLSIWRAFLGFLAATLGYVLSLYEKNIFIVLSGPFVFTLIDSFILASLAIPQYNLFTAFEPSSLVPGSTSPVTFLAGMLSFVFAAAALYVFYHVFRKEDVYQI